jgi:hypothetical protein
MTAINYKSLPQENGCIVSSLSVVSAPAETFRIYRKVFSNSQDGEWKTLE